MDSDANRFRRSVGDRVKADENILVANGEIVEFQLRHENVWGITVYYDDVIQTTGYLITGQPGLVAFTIAPAEGVEVRVTYQYAAYTNDEVTTLIGEYGLSDSIIIALEEILADASKLRDYKEADSEVKNSQVFKNIKDLLDYYMKKNSGSVRKARRINDNYKADATDTPDLTRLM